MASIYKRGKVWWIHYLVGGKSVSRSLKTTNGRTAAENKKKLEALDVIGQLAEPSNTSLTPFLQSFCEFLMSTRTHKSAKNDISYLRSFFGPCCPALELGSNVPHKFRRKNLKLPQIPDKLKDRHIPVRRLEEISTQMINNFIQTRIICDSIKPKTANRIREVLSRMFGYAQEHYGYVCPDRRYKNPVKGIRKVKEPAAVIRWLKVDEIADQLEALKQCPVIHAMVAVYIYAGLRREESLWLIHDDVDLTERLIRVQAKEVHSEFWQPKTKSNRVIPMSNALNKILSGYQAPENSIWFFPSPKGKRWDPDNFSQRLRSINTAVGLNWSCSDFRHTFGSHLAQKGVSLYKISKLMGNSPEVCRKHYAALVPEEMTEVVEFQLRRINQNGEDETPKILKNILQELRGQGKDGSRLPKVRLVRFDDSA
jgi:integrase